MDYDEPLVKQQWNNIWMFILGIIVWHDWFRKWLIVLINVGRWPDMTTSLNYWPSTYNKNRHIKAIHFNLYPYGGISNSNNKIVVPIALTL